MSPTLFRIGNMRVVIYPRDHFPPHVHIVSPDGEAKFELETMNCIFVKSFSKKDIKKIKEFLVSRKNILLELWNDYQE